MQQSDAVPEPAAAVTVPSGDAVPRPDRPASCRNLGREECAWRSALLRLESLEVYLDLTPATQPQGVQFPVRSRLVVSVRQVSREGAWVDFLGQEVRALVVDGQRAEVRWDGARLTLPPLAVGRHVLEVEAVGLFSNTGQGLHRFHDPVDQATYLYTHFEPSDARRAWPCLEQPDLKAPFTLTVEHPQGWLLLGNGTVETTETTPDGTQVTRLAPTKPLPSYLTALAAGPWHQVTGQWRSRLRPQDPPVDLSWCCRASLAEHLDAAELLTVTRSGLDLYDRSYGFPYPWGSYDSVLVPEYNLGAMENPGCVTFNEDRFLFRGPATRAQRGSRANVVLHEMCHMWFGDLVTPRWWDDIWLKESFADHQGTWAQAEATDFDDAWVAFAAGRKAWAYLEDSRPETTHPIVATVTDVEAARQTFDGISYAKGAAVLKQLVAHVGQEAFTVAAQRLFQGHAFGNASLADLMQVLGEATGQDMEAWAQAWLHTSGPSVIRPRLESADGRIRCLRLEQECTDPRTGQQVLRPHTLKVGFYQLTAEGRLRRTCSLPVVLDQASVCLSQAEGLVVPDLLTVNDEDLTYAVVRPDPVSLRTALRHLAALPDPLTRAVWWSVLHNLVRDALLRPQQFIQAVLTQADDSTAPATLGLLLEQARLATRMCPPEERLAALLPLTVADRTRAGEGEDEAACGTSLGAWPRLRRAAAGSDAQLVRARAWVRAAGGLGQAPSQWLDLAEARLRQVLGGALPGLEVDHDLRWIVLTSLARIGRLEEEDLRAQEQADSTSKGLVSALRVRYSAPTAHTKEQVFRRLLEDQALSNDQADALVEAFGPDAHHSLTAAFTARYLEQLEQVWAGRSQEVASRLVSGLFPHVGTRQDAQAVRSWLAEHGQAPSALTRLLRKHLSDLERCLRCQEACLQVAAGAAQGAP